MQDTQYCYLIGKCQNCQKLHSRGMAITATLCFHLIVLCLQDYAEITQPIFTKFDRHGPWKKLTDFTDNLDHVMLGYARVMSGFYLR